MWPGCLYCPLWALASSVWEAQEGWVPVCPCPLGLLGHPLHTLEEAEAGAQGQGLHLDNTPTQGTKAHCLGPRWRGSGWEAASRLSPNPLVVGRLRSNSQSPAPAWATGQAASQGRHPCQAKPAPTLLAASVSPAQKRPGEHRGGRVELAVGLGWSPRTDKPSAWFRRLEDQAFGPNKPNMRTYLNSLGKSVYP